jgi:hypothetical protein
VSLQRLYWGARRRAHYEPKDLEREAWLQRASEGALLARLGWQTLGR